MTLDWKTSLFWIVFAVFEIDGPAHSEETEGRLIREAKVLFQLVKADESSHPALERCGVRADWDTTPVPDYVAHEQFGITIRAGLSAPTQNSTPAEVLALGATAEDIFCSAVEAKKYANEKLSLVKSGQSNGESAKFISYTFPVFNAGYTKAVVIYTDSSIIWTPANADRHGTIEFAVVAFVYTKAKGRWHKAARIELSVT